MVPMFSCINRIIRMRRNGRYSFYGIFSLEREMKDLSRHHLPLVKIELSE